MIASVVQATAHMHFVWERLSPRAKDNWIEQWTNLIENDPEVAADQIMQSIMEHPDLGQAWRKLGPIGPSRRAVFTFIVSEYIKGQSAL